jgi:hypothetical protein
MQTRRSRRHGLVASALTIAVVVGLELAPAPWVVAAAANQFTVTGKYHGTLTVTNPAVGCFVDEFSNPHLSDSVKLGMSGTLSGLHPTSWFLLITEPRQGTFVTKHSNQATSAKLRPTNANVDIGFSQTSGTIAFNGRTGSVNLKVVFNNGYENTVSGTLAGSWSCPRVQHL